MFGYSLAFAIKYLALRHRNIVVCSIPDSDFQTPIRESDGRNCALEAPHFVEEEVKCENLTQFSLFG
jgi:hypothetical protein